MDNDYVNLDNAKRLSAQGYQTEFPAMLYVEGRTWQPEWWTIPLWVRRPNQLEWYAAPTHLAAFLFLRTKDYAIHITLYDGYADYEAEEIKNSYDTPDKLISAILDHLEGASNDSYKTHML